MHGTTLRAHRGGRRRARALVVAVAAALVLAACSGDDGDGGTTAATGGDGSTATTAPAAAAVDYSDRGPYEVGFQTVDVEGTEVYLLYPAAADAIEASEHVTSISSDVAFPESFRAVAPDFFIQELATDHYLDAPVDDEGPFPVVLSSHGFSGHPAYVISHLEHLASWGYVVAAPSHPSRNLEASITGTVSRDGDPDVADLVNTLDLLEARNADQDDLLFGAVDTSLVAAEGHSAGGGAVGRLAMSDDRLATYIGQAPGAPVDIERQEGEELTDEERATAVEQGLAAAEPPAVPVLLIAGERDGVIPLTAVQALYEWLDAPKQLVVVANAGHNPFLDICANLQDQGGLVANAGDLAETFGPLLQLGEDGCLADFLDAETGYAMLDHLSVAWLRWTFGQDDSPAAVSPEFLEDTFPEATGPVEQEL